MCLTLSSPATYAMGFLQILSKPLVLSSLSGRAGTLSAPEITRNDFEGFVGSPMPTALNSLEALQTYAAYYALARNYAFVLRGVEGSRQISTTKEPCLRVSTVKKDYGVTRAHARMATIFAKSDHLPGLASTVQAKDADIYLAIAPHDQKHADELREDFATFLLVNNEQIFPDAERVLGNMLKLLQAIHTESETFIEQVRLLNPNSIAKWMKLDGFSLEEKGHLIDKLQGIHNDVTRKRLYLEHMMAHWDTMQILDVIQLGEIFFDGLTIALPVIKDIVESGYFFPDSEIEAAPRMDIGRFFSHRQCPLRSSYLFDLAMGTLLQDVVNDVRMKANLEPLPASIFVQPDYLKKVFEINETLLPFKSVYAAQEVEDSQQWIMNSTMLQFKKQAAKAKKAEESRRNARSKKSKPVKELRKNRQTTQIVNTNSVEQTTIKGEPENRVAQALPQLAQKDEIAEITLGARVMALLNEREQTAFAKLFAQHDLTTAQINEMVFGVYRALVDLNRYRVATRFLKKMSDTRLYQAKNIHEPVAKELLQRRLVVFLTLDIVHPEFTKEQIMQNESISKQVLTEKMLTMGKSNLGVNNVVELLLNAESVVEKANQVDQRRMLVNLAHSWHRYAQELEMQKSRTAKSELGSITAKIVNLLKSAQDLPASPYSTGILEAYLMSYYLNIDQTPLHEPLSYREFADIQRRAYHNFTFNNPRACFDLTTITPDHQELSKTAICNSIFHAMTNGEVDDYLIVKFDRAIKDRKLPLFIRWQDKIYRTDVFGGSRLRPNLAEGDYGSVVAVSLRAGEFFERWFTSEESFWYGQRAFLPKSEENAANQIHGDFVVQTVPDENFTRVLGDLIVHDGFGYIKASKAKRLGLKKAARTASFSQPQSEHGVRNVAFQAFHGYASEPDAARDLFKGTCRRHERARSAVLTNDEVANVYRCTVPKLTAVGIPVSGDKIVLPTTPVWQDFVKSGAMLGRNPYSARSLQHVEADNIRFDDVLNDLQVFQYTLTGLYEVDGDQISGSFFKGLLAVVDDNDWPWDFAHADAIVSSKDEKLNQAWADENDKKRDQASARMIKMRGVLFVTQELGKRQVAGVPPALADKLAGDFDGDDYDFLTCNHYGNVAALVKRESATAILNPKMRKSFTPRKRVGNYGRILALRRPILETWNGIINRFYHLPLKQRLQLAQAMAPTNLLREWLEEEEWQKYSDDLDIVTVEIQVGIKLGEDIFKTTVNSERVMERARAYEHALQKMGSKAQLPYGASVKKKLDSGHPINAAMKDGLMTPTSANLFDKASRAVSRYLNDDKTYKGYLSDDGEEEGRED